MWASRLLTSTADVKEATFPMSPRFFYSDVYVQCASIADSADSVVILNEREKSLHQLKSI